MIAVLKREPAPHPPGGPQSGHWRPAVASADLGDGGCDQVKCVPTAVIGCGGTCGRSLSLHGHTIDRRGQVSPSVECTACRWHGSVVLEGWA